MTLTNQEHKNINLKTCSIADMSVVVLINHRIIISENFLIFLDLHVMIQCECMLGASSMIMWYRGRQQH